MDEKRFALESQTRMLFHGAVWSHKIQEVEADRLSCQYRILEFITICTSAVKMCIRDSITALPEPQALSFNERTILSRCIVFLSVHFPQKRLATVFVPILLSL